MDFIYAVLAYGVMRGTKRVVGAAPAVFTDCAICGVSQAVNAPETPQIACGRCQRQEVVMVAPDVVNRALGNGRDPRIGGTVEA
jgi:hypothetical protein